MMRQAQRGLTLFEVVLAVSFTVALMVAVMAFYRHVADVRDEFSGQLRQVQIASTERMVMDRMTNELRSAIVYPFIRIGMSGSETRMQFVTTAVPSSAVWAVRDVLDEPTPPEHDLQMVSYNILQYENDYGEWIIEGLQRSCQKIIAVEIAEEGLEIQSTLIAPQYKFAAFRYWDADGGQWLPNWEGGDLPMAVEIVLGVEPLPEDMEVADYPYEIVRRVVYVPGGSKALGRSTIIRGLEEGF